MSITRPVSRETLASIPWMSGKSLSHAMREVSLRGPNDAETWRNLLSRADVIVESLNAKQSALILNAISRVRDLAIDYEPFLKRFVKKFLIRVIDQCNALDVAQLVHALASFQSAPAEVLTKLRGQIALKANEMEEKELSMTAVGLAKLDPTNPHLPSVEAVLERGSQLCKSPHCLNDQTVAQLLSLAKTCGMQKEISPLVERATILVHSDDPSATSARSAVLILTCLSTSTQNAEYVSGFIDKFLGSSKTSCNLSLKQLIVTLRSLQKLGVTESNPAAIHRLIDNISNRMTRTSETAALDGTTLCMLLNSLSRIPRCVETRLFNTVLTAIFIKSKNISSSDATVLMQSLARVGKNTLDPALIDSILEKVYSIELSGKELSIVAVALSRIYGAQMSVKTFQWVADRCKFLQQIHAISDTDLASVRIHLDKV